jgi:hypothetical protein
VKIPFATVFLSASILACGGAPQSVPDVGRVDVPVEDGGATTTPVHDDAGTPTRSSDDAGAPSLPPKASPDAGSSPAPSPTPTPVGDDAGAPKPPPTHDAGSTTPPANPSICCAVNPGQFQAGTYCGCPDAGPGGATYQVIASCGGVTYSCTAAAGACATGSVCDVVLQPSDDAMGGTVVP